MITAPAGMAGSNDAAEEWLHLPKASVKESQAEK